MVRNIFESFIRINNTTNITSKRRNLSIGSTTANYMQTIVKDLSKNGISSQHLEYRKLHGHFSSYSTKTVQPLFIVFITSKENFHAFQNATKNDDMSTYTWLIIFTKSSGKDLRMFCQNPQGNPLNVLFNARFLVKCYDDDILREWYSVHKNVTEVFDLAILDPENRIVLKTNQSFRQRRSNMQGKSLKIARVNILLNAYSLTLLSKGYSIKYKLM